MTNLPMIASVTFDENPDRLKVMWPVKRNWLGFVIYSLLLLLWLVLLVGGVVYTWQIAFSGERFAFVFTVMLLILLYILFRFGAILWRQWQYFAADREILFVNQSRLIVRRPVSLLGLTDAFDMAHVSPFYVSEKHHCPAFDYGYQNIYFGRDLPPEAAAQLVLFLNGRFFPHLDDDDED